MTDERAPEAPYMTERERGDRLEAMIERLAERNVEAGLEISGRVLDAVRNEVRLQTIEDFREWGRRKGGSTRVMMDRAIQEITSWALRSEVVPDHDVLTERLAAAEGLAAKADELLYLAWTVIANAGQGMGGWEHESAEWVGAAERWRDRWHEFIGPSRATMGEGSDG